VKHSIITEPKTIGCWVCARKPPVVLPPDWSLGVGFGSVELIIDDKMAWLSISEEHGDKTVAWLTEKFRRQLDAAECALLHFDQPLHDETYEFNKDDGKWYLVKQGQGFA